MKLKTAFVAMIALMGVTQLASAEPYKLDCPQDNYFDWVVDTSRENKDGLFTVTWRGDFPVNNSGKPRWTRLWVKVTKSPNKTRPTISAKGVKLGKGEHNTPQLECEMEVKTGGFVRGNITSSQLPSPLPSNCKVHSSEADGYGITCP